MNADALIGTALGTCTLQKIIGQGGMGAVFLAQQSRPRRQVAVKVLLPATALTPHQRTAFLERFRRETDAAASLEHPNILPVHEYGERDGFAYLVVPYISGGTLREHMEQEEQLPLPKVLNYLEQIAAALDFAHEHGVIHRDIKPANILMTPEGRLLLTDFGLVKIITEGQTAQMRLTGAGAPVGTPDYMAPEQVLGEVVDGRSDLYSLGVIVYQMVTGTTPFQGETPMQIAAHQMQTPPPLPRLLRVDLPLAAEQVMLRVMAKRPSDRYASGQEFAEAFRDALSFAGVALNGATSKTLAVSTSTSARLFTPRNLFDPGWQNGSTGSMPSATPATNFGQGKPTAVLPAALAADVLPAPARPSGLLSRTGMFPAVGGATGRMPAATGNTTASATITGTLTAEAPSAIKPESTSVLSALTGAQPTVLPPGLNQLSPVRNTTGALAVPNTDQRSGNTMKLTSPVKVVQVPLPGQPGHYVTGLLPVIPQTQLPTEQIEVLKTGKKPWQGMMTALLVLLVILASGVAFWYSRSHSSQAGQVATVRHVAGTPDVRATAVAQVQATAEANQILSDPLNQNIHNLPTGKDEFFAGGAYHIQNTEGNAVAVVLPEQPFNIPNAYTLTMWEVKGDDTSSSNSFGMVIRFSQQTRSKQTITTFYSFEVVNTQGGEYRFYKYDDSSGNPDKFWTQLWSKPFSNEFHQGQGPKNANKLRIYQNGSSFSFTVNGTVVGTVSDNSYKSGTLGMLVNLKGTEVAFMNMVITHK
ncbi:MAG: hypothetical protein NVSMB33_09050 [Ktedonobacteraceae bacterium]